MSQKAIHIRVSIAINHITKQVVNEDCLVCALKYDNAAVLNMANADWPGGGYRHGAGAQVHSLHPDCMHYRCDGFMIVNQAHVTWG